MQDQLSLFSQDKTTAEERQSAFDWALDKELSATDELLALAGRWRSAIEYRQLLDCLIRFPKYSIFNALLLYLQNPRVSRVATAGRWLRKHNRIPKPNAQPLIILAPMAPVLFVFDVADTEGPPLPLSTAAQPACSADSLREIFKKTLANCDLHGICVRTTSFRPPESEKVVRLTAATRKRFQALELSPTANYLILLDQQGPLSNRYTDLVSGLGQIFSGHFGIHAGAWWPERAGLSTETEDIETRSMLHLITGRQGSAAAGAFFLDPYLENARSLPIFSLNSIIQAAGYIEDMGKRRWSNPKKKSRYKS